MLNKIFNSLTKIHAHFKETIVLFGNLQTLHCNCIYQLNFAAGLCTWRDRHWCRI